MRTARRKVVRSAKNRIGCEVGLRRTPDDIVQSSWQGAANEADLVCFPMRKCNGQKSAWLQDGRTLDDIPPNSPS